MDANDAPGRSCPVAYRYSPADFRRPAEIEAETLYVIGGLYGNPFDALWPAHSAAAVSYRRRIAEGPAYEPHQAVRGQTRHAHAPRPTVAAP